MSFSMTLCPAACAEVAGPTFGLSLHPCVTDAAILCRGKRGLCPLCRDRKRVIDRARAVGEYDGTLREIIHAFKYSGRRSLADPIARLMRVRGTELLDKADCVVPVPLHWRREYSRGFNQARELARHLGLPLVDALVPNTSHSSASRAGRGSPARQCAKGLRTAPTLAFQSAFD